MSKVNRVTIVGAGPAGISLAKTLLESGIAVNLVCGGSPIGDVKLQRLYLESNFKREHHEKLNENRIRGIGGTSESWGGRLVEFTDSDFSQANLSLGTKWPITKPDLIPFYEKSLKFFGINDSRDSLIPNESIEDADLIELLGADLQANVGFEKFDVCTPEIWTEIGNVYDSKIRNLLSFENFTLYEDWHLTRIVLSENESKVESIVIGNLEGRFQNLESIFLVLACGAIENSRQLLLLKESSSHLVWAKLANVGKGYSSHVFLHLREIYKPQNFFWNFRKVKNGLLKNRLRFDFRNNELSVIGAAYFAYPPLVNRGLSKVRILNYFQKYGLRVLINKDLLIRSVRKLKELRMKSPDDIDVNSTQVRDRQCLYLQLEKVANEESRILLGENLDTFGNRLPNARLHFSSLEKDSYAKICDLMCLIFPQFQVDRIQLKKQVQSIYDFPNSHAHQIGGTVMGSCNENSVVDSNCRVNGILNLYVAGSSIFPTAGEANPTHTIVALAIRLGEHLSSEVKNQQTI